MTFQWIKRFFVRKQPPVVPEAQPVRRKVDNEAIRARIKAQGWQLIELPIRKNNPVTKEVTISRWKVIAVKGEKSLEVGGTTIEEAVRNIGINLGLVQR